MAYPIFDETIVELPWPEVAQAGKNNTPILFPVSIIEEHGPHMNSAPDVYLVHQLAKDIKRNLLNQKMKSLIAPPLYWGISQMTECFPGTFSIRPKWYLNESTTKGIPTEEMEHDDYGFLWWIGSFSGVKAYYAGGYGGQYLIVVPELNTIIVTMSEMDAPHKENKRLVANLITELKENTKMSNRKKGKKQLLSEEERMKAIELIQAYFKLERDESIGIIAADNILDFFIDNIGKGLCKKAINKFRENLFTKLDDAEIEALQILE